MLKPYTAFWVVFIMIAVLAAGYSLHGWQECRERGGAWVQSVVWYECVAIERR